MKPQGSENGVNGDESKLYDENLFKSMASLGEQETMTQV